MRFSFTNRHYSPREATDFLRRDSRLAALLPGVQRTLEMQRDCLEVLPAAFKFVEILGFDGGNLTLATPNAAVAAKLKQQLPKLQEMLQRKGWQINNIKLKVQMMKGIAPEKPSGEGWKLPGMALDSFADLSDKLAPTDANAPLIEAMRNLVARRRTGG